MGENEGWAEANGSLLNGLMAGAGPIMQAVDPDRWLKAEERTAELISRIQPNQLSEQRRFAVADYVQRLIKKCFPCEVCTFGSVPLKTYLPDGDIDLTAFSQDQSLKGIWAKQVRDMLENEEKNEDAEFHVKEVQFIDAEVKLIKCLVENIVVDISFNQVGGLCTLCFLDEVDARIKQNHLFKRSIILIKAWCYYESRILGAHHALISTYALETLVLYIFNVFGDSFHGPLEVLYRFMEFFSNFDWDNFCISLWGPVRRSALPDVSVEPPRNDNRELLLSKSFLDACSNAYAVYPGDGKPFAEKHLNVIDPLRVNNNLGRSVNKANFFRIRSAFAFGAKKLARILSCPKQNLIFEVNQFFMNTLERHGSGLRPDAPGLDSWGSRISTPDSPQKFGIPDNRTEGEGNRFGGLSSHRKFSKNQQNLASSHGSHKIKRDPTSDQVKLNQEVKRDAKVNHFVNDTQGHFLFARTRSSPELTDTFVEVSYKSRQTKAESANANARVDTNNRRKNRGSESVASHSTRSSVEDTSSTRNNLPQQSFDAEADFRSTENNQWVDEEFSSSTTHTQEQQDIVNMISSTSLHGFNGQFNVPFNLPSSHLPFPNPRSFFASMGYDPRNLPGLVPSPFIDPSFPNMHFPPGLVPPELAQYFPNFGQNRQSDDSVKQTNENFVDVEINIREADGDLWQEQDVGSSDGYDHGTGNFGMHKPDNKPPASLTGLKYVPPFRANAHARVQQKYYQKKHGSVRESVTGGKVYEEERPPSSKFSSATRNSSLRSRTSSESSWDGSAKTAKSSKGKRVNKVAAADLAAGYGKGKILSDHESNQAEVEHEWNSLSNVGPEMVERNQGPESVSYLQIPGHHMPGFEVSQTNRSDPAVSFGPMVIRPGSGHKTGDNSEMVFYPTGPPVPFLTMLYPPHETGTSDASSVHLSETLDTTESEQNISPKEFDEPQHLNSSLFSRGIAATEEPEEPDILNSDYYSHMRNLRVGRSCTNLEPAFFPSPLMPPPLYPQGQFPYDTPGRPLPHNSNILSQLMTSNSRPFVPVSPIESLPGGPPNMYQHYADEMPRYRGTGTYLPNHNIPTRERQSLGARRGNQNHERNDNHADREGNWNGNSKPRGAARGNIREQGDRQNSRTERFAPNEGRSRNSYRHDGVPLYQPPNGPLRSTTNQNGPHYSMYPLAPSRTSGPPLMMMYPVDRNAVYDSQGEQPESGFSGNEQSQLDDGIRAMTFEDHSGQQPSPDQPSSPRHQRAQYRRNRR